MKHLACILRCWGAGVAAASSEPDRSSAATAEFGFTGATVSQTIKGSSRCHDATLLRPPEGRMSVVHERMFETQRRACPDSLCYPPCCRQRISHHSGSLSGTQTFSEILMSDVLVTPSIVCPCVWGWLCARLTNPNISVNDLKCVSRRRS